MTTKEKLITGILGGLTLYVCSAIDYRVVTERFVDCKVGKYTFTIKANECKQLSWSQIYLNQEITSRN